MKTEVVVMPEWEELKKYAVTWEAGKLLTHEDLCEIMCLKVNQKYYNIMKRAIQKLTEIGIRLSNVRNVGYKVLTADEWVLEAKKKLQKGGKSMKEAQDIINHAPYLRMSEESREECMKLHDLMIKQKFLFSGGVVQIEKNIKKPKQIREGNVL
jgi:hypothetical protein